MGSHYGEYLVEHKVLTRMSEGWMDDSALSTYQRLEACACGDIANGKNPASSLIGGGIYASGGSSGSTLLTWGPPR